MRQTAPNGGDACQPATAQPTPRCIASSNALTTFQFRVRDFDGGIVGQTLISTLESMRSNEMPGWEITNGTITDVVQSVWNAHYWGAIVVQPGASARLQEALANPTAAANYDPSSAMKNYLTGARYFTTYSSYIRPGFTEALAATTAQLSGYAAAQALSANAGATVGTAGMQALAKIIAQPVASTEVDMAPLPFQPRVFLNTFGVVVPNLAGFFFNMIIMGVFMEAGVYSHPTTMWKLVRAKFIIKIIWCVLASLVVTSVNFSFRESYTYPAKNFFALWTNMLFYCWLNYNIFGGLIAWLHVKYMMFFVFPIVVTSVAAAVFPPEVGDTFYDISYMFPSHAYWMIAITIFGRGCCNRLRLYAPIVMVWVIVTELFWLTGDWRYSRNSRKGAGVPKAEPDGDNAVTQIVFPQEQEENEPDPYPLARSISTTVRRMSRSSQAGPPGAAAPAKRASVSR